MNWPIEQKIRLGFGLALAFLLVIGAVSYRNAIRSTEAVRWVDHTQRVIEQLDQTLIAALNLETGARGYALTGDEAYLAAYQRGAAAAQEKAKAVRRSTTDSPVQQKALDVLESLITRKLALAKQLLEQSKTQGFEVLPKRAGMRDGKEVMDEIRRVIEEMAARERRLLQARSLKAQADARITSVVAIFGTLMGMVFIGIARAIVLRDFKKRKAAEEEQERFFTLSLDMLCIAGFDGYFQRLNSAWEKTLGFTPEELLAQPYLDFIHPDDRAGTVVQAEKIAAGAELTSFENRYRCKDGSYRWLLWNAKPVMEAGMIYGAARDITETRQAGEEIRALNQNLSNHANQLEGANKELEAFSYSVSHDLRAPLRHVQGFLELLQAKAGPALDAKCKRYMSMVFESAKTMGQLIDDLLSFSRMGRAEMHSISISLEALVKDVIDQLTRENPGREIIWKTPSLPVVQADPPLLRQVFVNLLSNALKYSRTRSRSEIEIASSPDQNGEHVIFVRDNGVGFDLKYASKLFGVFQRLHREEEFEGTGIGLANVQRIINRHGGRAWAEAVLDGGATFYFSLPKHQTKLL